MLAVCLMLLKFFVGYFHHGDKVLQEGLDYTFI